nr:MAG TPA: Protein of unknown function (DUF551) [Caudoviricetes sp.]
MNVLEKILEEIKEAFDENIDDIEDSAGIHHFAIDSFTAWYIARKIIRSHMDNVPDNNDGWIPVSEKLPEESDYYMACICNDEVCDYDFRKTWFAHADDYDMDKSEWRELYDFERVIAWQPLLEPYKEK